MKILLWRYFCEKDSNNILCFEENKVRNECASILKLIFDRMEVSRLNPDWQIAELHGISTFPGIVFNEGGVDSMHICPCCLNVIRKEQAPLCENSKQLQFLGFGFPLFYVFIKYCIILLLVSICSYNALEIYWSISANADTCHGGHIDCSFMLYLSSMNKHVDNAEVMTRVLSFVVQMGVLLYIRDLISKTRNYYDERTCSLSDYSILVTNIPEKTGMRARLIKFLGTAFKKPYYPHQVTFLPQYENFYKMEENIAKLVQEIKKCVDTEDTKENRKRLEDLEAQLEAKDRQLTHYCERELALEENDQSIAEKLIFSCGTEDEKDAVLEGFEDLSEQMIRQAFGIQEGEECEVGMEEAPQPKQINWEHINYPENKRVGRMIAGWTLTTLFLAAITVVFFFMLSEKSILIEESLSQEHHGSYTAAVAMVYLGLISVIFFNKFVMGAVLHKITAFERHPTTARLEFHFALKYSVGMFFTTALMTLAVEDLRFHNFYKHPYGVIEEQFVMFFMNALFVPFIWLINPWQIMVLLKRKFNYDRKDLTQKQANKIMENVQYNMGKRYAEIIEIMWFTYLYTSLIPFGACLSALGLCLYYWIDKYNLLRRSSVNSNIAGELSLFSMKLLDFTLLFKPLGELLFDFQIRDSYRVSSVVMAALALVYLVAPIDTILQYLHPEKFKAQEKGYEDVQSSFKNTYQTLHPIFSLKEQNQQKVANAFSLVGQIIDTTLDARASARIKISRSPSGLAEKPLLNEKGSLQIENMSENESSAHVLDVKAFKDTTNILQGLFKSNKVNHVTNEKENFHHDERQL